MDMSTVKCINLLQRIATSMAQVVRLQQRLPKLPKTDEISGIRRRTHCRDTQRMDMSVTKYSAWTCRRQMMYGTGDEVACRLRLGRPKLLRMDEC